MVSSNDWGQGSPLIAQARILDARIEITQHSRLMKCLTMLICGHSSYDHATYIADAVLDTPSDAITLANDAYMTFQS